MKNLICIAIFSSILAACAGFGGAPLVPGAPVAAVRARLGQPTATYTDGADTLLEYATGPAGQTTFMARINAEGKLVSYDQVLTSAGFAKVKIGQDTRATILRRFGRPTQEMHFALSDEDVWAYRYKEQDVWNSMMYIHFFPDGRVKMLSNGPDPDRESRRGR